MNKKRFICIHGHFYQPPRENPWTEYLEIQDSAAPAHDWNERVFQECYAPNSFARINQPDGTIVEMINNYEWISFNFGPTILSWIERFHEEIYNRILEADKRSCKHFSGHGNALAQVYNHIIMPLANKEDKYNQIIWGIADFEKRFNRKPEGMWLAETAVDLETLCILKEQGIKFTVLSPYQAKSFRKILSSKEKNMQETDWQDASGGRIDPKHPYIIKLPDGHQMALFFYDGNISKTIAFEGTLDNADNMIQALFSGFTQTDEPQMVHVATDGESYGHHKKFGDMTLAYAIEKLRKNSEIDLINYGSYLEKFPPKFEAEIFENSSWSCAHGIERWRSNCGCTTSSQPGWTQNWRNPLRQALDLLRDAANEIYHQKMLVFCSSIQDVFHDYYYVVHSKNTLEIKKAFAEKHCSRALNPQEIQDFFKLLEIRRNANLMYTSCGWFFSEISGIETVQILAYAGRVIQLLTEFDVQIESQFLNILRQAVSNVTELQNGEVIYQKYVKPLFLDLKKMAIHYAITSLFEDYTESTPIFSYTIETQDYIKDSRGINRFCVGHIIVTSDRTLDQHQFQFAVLHYGETDFHCALQSFETKAIYQVKKEKLLATFRNDHLTELVQLLMNELGTEYFTLSDVLIEDKRKILNLVLESEIDRLNQMIFYMAQKNKKIVEYCFKEAIPVPKPLVMFNEYTYQKVIEHMFSGETHAKDLIPQVSQVLNLIKVLGFSINLDEQLPTIQHYLERSANRYFNNPESVLDLNNFVLALKAVNLLPKSISYWNLENQWYQFLATKEEKLFNQDKIIRSKIPLLLKEVKQLLKINIIKK